MATDIQKHANDLLRQMSRQGLQAAKYLFWTELSYDQVNHFLYCCRWPDPASQALKGDPLPETSIECTGRKVHRLTDLKIDLMER